jgi:flagellar M-ring protein FliF
LALENILDQFRRFGIVRLGAMALVTLSLMTYFGYVIFKASQPSLSVLYSELAPEDSSAISRELDAKAIAYELRDDGRVILVSKTDIAKLRLDLASKGIPSGGTVGYEIFDKTDSFSTTGFVQSINQVRALEGEIARSIRTIGAVQSARVHLVIPERKLFERDRQPPRASIALKIRGDLSAQQVNAIRRLVASAVDGLKPENVSIIDEQGRLLADGTAGEPGSSVAMEEKQLGLEKRMKAQIEEIVASVVGQGRARVQISAELDPSRVQTVAETYDPDSRVVRSTQNRNESATTTEVKDGAVSVANELPGANSANTNQKDASGKNEEIVNYEISKTTRTEVSEGGKVRRMSVAVLVDGTYEKGANGEATYQPRPQADLDRIAALVKSGIGYDAKRGDQIEIVNLRFAAPPETLADPTPTAWYDLSHFDIGRLFELGVLAGLSLMITLFVGRPLVKAMALPGPRKGQLSLPGSSSFDEIDANPLDQISGLIAANPQASATTVRQWLQDNR